MTHFVQKSVPIPTVFFKVLTFIKLVILDNTYNFSYSRPQYWKIRVGSTYRTHGGSIYNVKSIIHHPEFDESYYNNDIAILVTTKRLSFNNNVRQGTLLKQGVEIKPNSVALLVGWGVTEVSFKYKLYCVIIYFTQ